MNLEQLRITSREEMEAIYSRLRTLEERYKDLAENNDDSSPPPASDRARERCVEAIVSDLEHQYGIDAVHWHCARRFVGQVEASGLLRTPESAGRVPGVDTLMKAHRDIHPNWTMSSCGIEAENLHKALTALADAPGGGARVTVTQDDVESLIDKIWGCRYSDRSLVERLDIGDARLEAFDWLRSKGIAVEPEGAGKESPDE